MVNATFDNPTGHEHSSSAVPTECLIVLIHGTFATKAAWPRASSAFRKRLETQLTSFGIDRPQVEAIVWNGGNRDIDRESASLDLRRELRAWTASQPDRPVFLIGHSHGGNIALHALVHSEELRCQVQGVATLATPFLVFDHQPALIARAAATLVGLRWSALLLGTITLFAGLFFGVLTFLIPWFFDLKIWMMQTGRQNWGGLCRLILTSGACHSINRGLIFTVGSVFGIIYTFGLVALAWDFSHQAHHRALVRAQRSFRQFSYVQPPSRLCNIPILVLSSLIDEARQGLNGAWWIHRAALWSVRLGFFFAIVAGLAAAAWSLWWLNSQGEAQLAIAGTSFRLLLFTSLSASGALAAFCAGATLIGALFQFMVRFPVPGVNAGIKWGQPPV